MRAQGNKSMSRAFVKDGEQEFAELPDRLISEHPNLVTPEGLAQIEAEIARLNADHATAQAAQDREALATVARDLRYWKARQLSAEVVTPPEDDEHVHFGSTVTIKREDGRRQTFRIVGVTSSTWAPRNRCPRRIPSPAAMNTPFGA